jgi:hypothetical protein
MKVKMLKAKLARLDDDMDIVLSRDPEGNGYSIADEDPEVVWFEDGDVCDDDEKDEYMVDPVRVFCIWPKH